MKNALKNNTFKIQLNHIVDVMEGINFELVLPLNLQRRINRLVSIEDILKEVPISLEDKQKQLNDAGVSNKFALFVEQSKQNLE